MHDSKPSVHSILSLSQTETTSMYQRGPMLFLKYGDASVDYIAICLQKEGQEFPFDMYSLQRWIFRILIAINVHLLPSGVSTGNVYSESTQM